MEWGQLGDAFRKENEPYASLRGITGEFQDDEGRIKERGNPCVKANDVRQSWTETAGFNEKLRPNEVMNCDGSDCGGFVAQEKDETGMAVSGSKLDRDADGDSVAARSLQAEQEGVEAGGYADPEAAAGGQTSHSAPKGGTTFVAPPGSRHCSSP
jgi:hypothetical protein